MSRLVEVFCATQRHQKTKNKKQKKRNADKGSHGFTLFFLHSIFEFFPTFQFGGNNAYPNDP